MPDVLSIALEINDSALDASLEKDKQKVESFAADVEKNAPKVTVTSNVGAVGKEFSEFESRFPLLAASANAAFDKIIAAEEQFAQVSKVVQKEFSFAGIEAQKLLTAETIKEVDRRVLLAEKEASAEVAAIEAVTRANALKNAQFLASSEKEIAKSLEASSKFAATQKANALIGDLEKEKAAESGAGGNGFALLIGAGIAFDALEKSAKAATDAAAAQRVLQAEARESGVSFEELSKQAKLFGEQTLLSNRDAETSFAAIEKYAARAGRAGKGGEAATAIANLAAARGISPADIQKLTTQLEGGGSKVFEKLLSEKPKEFETGIDGITKKLTEAQKETQNFDELIRESALFSGEAEKRANDSASAIDRLNKKFEDTKESVGGAALRVVEFGEKSASVIGSIFSPADEQSKNELINETNKFFQDLPTVLKPVALPVNLVLNAADQLTAKLADLITGNNLTGDTKSGVAFNNQSAQVNKSVADLRDLQKQIADANKNPFGSAENFKLRNLNQAITFDTQGGTADPDAAARKAVAQAEADGEKEIAAKIKGYEKGIKRADGDANFLKLIRDQFSKERNIFDVDTQEKITNELADSISAGASKGFQRILSDTKTSLPQLRKSLNEILGSQDLSSDAKSGLAVQFQNKIKSEVDAGKNKAKELEKVYLGVYDSIAAKAGQNNPFVSLFTEADKSLRTLRESTKGLSKDLIQTFEQMQSKQNEIALFSARLDNRLNVFDLEDSADNFINPFKNQLSKINDDPSKFFGQYLEFYNQKIAADYLKTPTAGLQYNLTGDGKTTQGFSQSSADPYTRYNANIYTDKDGKQVTNGFSQSDARNDIFYSYDVVSKSDGSFGGFSRRDKTFADLSERDKKDYLQSLAKVDDYSSLHTRLDKQFQIVDALRGTAKNDEEKSIADRRIIALTQGLNPNQLTDSEREKAAIARENEAVHASNAEKDAKAEREKDRAIQQQIADNTKRFLDLAEKEGLKAVLEIVDKTGGGINFEPSPTNKDTQNYYDK